MPFELYGIQRQHLGFCRALSLACRLRFHSRQFRDEAVAMFEPSFICQPMAIWRTARFL
jgi:hypothetical protein